MTPLTIAQNIAAAILLGVGVLHLMVWGRLRDQWVHLLFGLVAMGAAANAIAEASFYHAGSIAEFNTAFKWANSINGVWLALLAWFVVLYSTGTPWRHRAAVAVTAFYVVAVTANVLEPYGVLYDRIDELRTISLPWGEHIKVAEGPANTWRIFTDIALLCVLALIVDGGIRLWRQHERRRGTLILGTVALLMICLLIAGFIDVGKLSFPYPFTYAFVIVALVMSYELAGEVVRAARLRVRVRRAEEGRDEALVKAESSLREVEALKSRLEEQVVYLNDELASRARFQEIVGESDALSYVLQKIEQVAPLDTTVLIEGETGVGKELVARAIHANSPRGERPMISVNISALAPTLVEAELFGYERGAFTGAAKTRKGRFELADGGTLFLDEIAEVPMEIQSKLLRILQEGEFERLGSEQTRHVNVRLIAASNRDLKQLASDGKFREDLFYRLHVYPITVPALRQRREDIPLLVRKFVRDFADTHGKKVDTVPQVVIDELTAYDWPGNVRELQNVIERAVITCSDSTLRLAGRLVGQTVQSNGAAPAGDNGYRGPLDAVEREYIASVLASCGWRIEGEKGAAILLGLHPNTLRSRMRKHGIERPA